MSKEWTEAEEAERLAERFKQVKNRADFARRYNVPGGGSVIYQHIKGLRPISFEAAVAYARGFGCQLREISPRLANQVEQARTLEAGMQEPDQTITESGASRYECGEKPAIYGVIQAQPVRHHLPVITWRDANMVREMFESGAVAQMPQVAYAGNADGRRLVVLIQDDDSMATSVGGAVSFPPGTEYMIDIDSAPEPGDYVLIPGQDRAFLRQLVSDATGRKLRPLNPQFDTIPYADRWIGTLVEAKLPLFRAAKR